MKMRYTTSIFIRSNGYDRCLDIGIDTVITNVFLKIKNCTEQPKKRFPLIKAFFVKFQTTPIEVTI